MMLRARSSLALALALACVVVGVLSMPPSAHASAATDRAEQLRYATETMNLGNGPFVARRNDFLAAGCATVTGCRKPTPYNSFDWSSDGCSVTPPSWASLFGPACQQHDFGYRNFGKGLTLGRNEATRKWLDDRLRAEMKSICNYRFSAWWQYANLQACFSEADVMYTFVRTTSDWSLPTPA
jgi:Prokaryotic phospholipase A2